MIYCIGLRMRYEPALAGPTPTIKRGSGVDADGRSYPGGWVWRSAGEARRYLTANGLAATHDVYGVRADWTRDTAPVPGEAGRRLVRDAEVVKL
jgi:hypothetical protein